MGAIYKAVDNNGVVELQPIVSTTDEKDIYSTSEVKTNNVWIDGRPIYRRVWTGTYNPGRYTDILPSGLVMIDITGYVRYTQDNGYRYWVINAPQNQATNVFFASVWYNDTGFVQLESTYSALAGSDCVVVFEYAKTTD